MTHQIHASTTASVTELKKNPMGTVAAGEGAAVAILNHNEPAFYCVPARTYEAMLERLKDVELKKLQAWCNPSEFYIHYRQADGLFGSVALFGNKGRFVREAYVAFYICKAKNADRVRLSAVNRPDFLLEINGHEVSFESTEVLDPSRKRHSEYKSTNGLPRASVKKWIEDANNSSSWIAEAVEKKCAKNYPSNISLVVYLNFSEFGIRHAQVVSGFAAATEAAANKFEEVWVLWNEKGYLVWKDGTCQIQC
jgi:antitoxin StbD